MTQGLQSESGFFAGRFRFRLLAPPLAVAALLAFCATPALAAKTHRFKTNIPTTAIFGSSVAVDESNGNVFIAEGSPTNKVIVTGPEGGPPSGVSPAEIGGLTSNFLSVAIDNSATSPSKGAVYVSEESGVVKKFVLVGEKYELKGELSATPAFGGVFGLTVDAKGNVFVADAGGKAVVEFNPKGEQIARLDVSASIGTPGTVALDSAGDLFMHSGTAAAYRFDANGFGEIEPGTEPVQIVEANHALGVAVDRATDDLYVSIPDEKNRHVAQYSASCSTEGEGAKEHCVPEGEFGLGVLTSPPVRLAVNSATGFVYVSEPEFNELDGPDVAVFGPTVIVPKAITGKATNVTGISATLNGTVDPAGIELDECKFEWGLATEPEYEHLASCAESPAEIGTGNSPVAVHADIPGGLPDLGLGTKYHFRLVATDPNTVPDEKGPSVGADENFTTLGPQVHCESASQIADTSARLEGCINPEGQATTYVFEYVSDADFKASEYAKALSAPLGGEAIGSGNEDVEVAQQIGGLTPSTIYHFRISATNHCNPDPEEECVAKGPDKTFATYLAQVPGLPDSRAYEQVTPLDKNGSAPTGTPGHVQAALDGSGIVYQSGGAIPGGEGAQQYPVYLSSRASEWSTQGLLPPASAGSSGAVLGWGEDLARVYDVQAPLQGSPPSFLERDSATHSLRAIVAEEGGLDINAFVYVGASADGSTVVFESNTPLYPGGAKNAFNTYAWDRESGELFLVGVLPDGSVPKKGSFAGSNTSVFHTHYLQAQHTLSSDGKRAFFTDAATGQLYLRQNPTASEEDCAVATDSCSVQVSASKRTLAPLKDEKPATFWAATPDGSTAFFTSPAKLTDDATTGPGDEGNDLYRYDVQSDQLIDLVPDEADPKGAEVQGVLGTSEDGAYVYFAANGKFGTAPSTGECKGDALSGGSGACNLYLSHNGAIAFIARLQLGGGKANTDSTNWLSAQQVGGGNTARVSPDGQTLLFRSQSKLDAYDNKGTPELYRYRVGDPQPQCVSCNPTEAAPVGAPTLRSIRSLETVPFSAAIQTRNLSTDGNRVFFETPDKLVASDVNGDGGCKFAIELSGIRFCQDVYEWEAKGTGSCESEAQNGGCLYLLSSGTSPEPSYFADADKEGNNAFLYTLDSLVKQDKDQLVDIYDARVGGGIASQNPSPPPPPCEGEACKGPAPTPPATESAGTSGFSGPGNPPPCKKGKVRKRGRCTKKSRSHKRQQHKKRHASGKRG